MRLSEGGGVLIYTFRQGYHSYQNHLSRMPLLHPIQIETTEVGIHQESPKTFWNRFQLPETVLAVQDPFPIH
jgi:hypothetical protein